MDESVDMMTIQFFLANQTLNTTVVDLFARRLVLDSDKTVLLDLTYGWDEW